MVLIEERDAASGPESELLDWLRRSYQNGERVILVVGSALDDHAIPRVSDVVEVAERYADGRNDDGDLKEALRQARFSYEEDSFALYEHYHRVLLDWLSPDEYNAIAQRTVLDRYQPLDRHSSPLSSHGSWQPISQRLGADLEADEESWQIPPSIQALGALLAKHGDLFGNRILTTNIDPLLEIAVRRARGRARSVVTNGTTDTRADFEVDAVTVYHLHGFWRPLTVASTGRLTDVIDDRASADIGRTASALMDGDLICVLGASDRTGTIQAAIAELGDVPALVWASPCSDSTGELLPEHVCLGPIDHGRVLLRLADLLEVAVPSAPATTTRVRHPAWERLFVSQPNSEPPDDTAELLQELDRRFAWRVEWSDDRPPEDGPGLVYWPVRLRRRTSVIHMIQAFAAGAMAARGAELVIALEDLSGPENPETRAAFEADLRRWVSYVAPDAEPSVQSLREYVEGTGHSAIAERLLRPEIDPWRVARDFYGRSVSLYTALAAVKALPNLAPHDLADNAVTIVQDLQRHNAGRLLTPTTTWSFLHFLLLDHASPSVITLGGRDEGLFWDQWHQIYGLPINQLYNPRIKSLTHESGMVRWDSREQLGGQLHRFRELPYWNDEGRFIHWLFQNAVLLPTYLNGLEVPRIGGNLIDSWAAFEAALDEGAPVLEMLADEATRHYLGLPHE
jgi:hypothetical protein